MSDELRDELDNRFDIRNWPSQFLLWLVLDSGIPLGRLAP